MIEGALMDFGYTWRVSRDQYGHVQLAITHEGKTTRPLISDLEEYGDDPLLHRFLLPDGASDGAVATTINAMREAVIATSKKWHRRTPWPDVPKPSLPDGLAPFEVYWGRVAATLNPDVAKRLEGSGVVQRIPAPKRPTGHPNPYVFELGWAHYVTETGRFLCIFENYAGPEARAQLCAWMDWGDQWEGWLAELERHAKHAPGAPSVFDVDW